jgi:hypothetical protein
VHTLNEVNLHAM